VKEPFVELMKSSLNTFLNAFTYPDKTCYPVASCNLQDFYNLVDVYLDAVFFPRLSPDVLAQEGHHLELESVESELRYKGVVFNEMKGAFSDPERVLASLSQQLLFPDITYGVESGGDPKVIPQLTWKEFSEFHSKYYHPSNARLYFYGDDDELKRLQKADEFLQEFEQRDVSDSCVGLQQKFESPKMVSFPYPVSKDERDVRLEKKKQCMATVNWMMDEIVSMKDEELVALSILDHVMTSNSGSPLYKALIDSEFGEEVIGGGLEMDLRQMVYSIGLKGMDENSAEKLERLVLDTLKRLSEDGFSKEVIMSSLNTIEFRLRENNTGSFPRGLALMLRSMTTWLHDSDPLSPLKYENALENVKIRLNSGENVLGELIRKYFLENSHRVVVELKPDVEMEMREEMREKQELKNIRERLSKNELESIVNETQRLKQKQSIPDREDDLKKIPRLLKSDLDTKIKTMERLEDWIGQENQVKLFMHPQLTNGIVYVDVLFDTKNVSLDQIGYVSLLTSILSEVGTTKRDFVELQQMIGRDTGGIRSGFLISQKVDGEFGNGEVVSAVTLRGKCVKEKVSDLIKIVEEIVMEIDLSKKERMKQLVIEERASAESSLIPSGHSYAASLIKSQYRKSDVISEYAGGVEYIRFLKDLCENFDEKWDEICVNLNAVKKTCIQQKGLVVNVTAMPNDLDMIRCEMQSFLKGIPECGDGFVMDSEKGLIVPSKNHGHVALVIPAQINYVGKGGNLMDLGFKPNGGSYLASKLLGTSYLWDTVRVKGGAYGGFCRLDMRSGTFMYLSYRDPNVKYTLDAYDGSGAYLKSDEITQDAIEKSVIGAIGDMDSYQLPDAKGYASMLRGVTGETDELRQKRRDEILGATKKDLVELGDALNEMKVNASVVVVASEDALNKAQAEGLEFERRTVM